MVRRLFNSSMSLLFKRERVSSYTLILLQNDAFSTEDMSCAMSSNSDLKMSSSNYFQCGKQFFVGIEQRVANSPVALGIVRIRTARNQ